MGSPLLKHQENAQTKKQSFEGQNPYKREMDTNA